MRKLWRDIANMNPTESDNKLVTHQSWFACPLLDLQAESRTVRNGGGPLMPPRYLCLDLPRHVMRNVRRFVCMHMLSQWDPPSGAMEMDTVTVTNAFVLPSKMRSTVFFTVKTCLCGLSERSIRSFFSLSASPFLWSPLLHALPSQTVFDFLLQQHNKLCKFISDIMDYF